MRDERTAEPAARPGAMLMSSLIAAGGTVAMGAAARSLGRTALVGHGDEALIAWVLTSLAGIGILLCLYLTAVWGLASLILLAGPASRTGTALLSALRPLAPRLAQRLTTGAAIATTATALVLTPALAAENISTSESFPATAPSAQTSQLFSTDGPANDPAHESAAPVAAEHPGSDDAAAPLPPLGWGEGASAASEAPEADDASEASENSNTSAVPGTPTDPHAEEGTAAPSGPDTVMVLHGDSLWSITDDLLGPGPSEPTEITAAWPLLHEANRDLIGQDPDLLSPGQQLTVPAALTTQDTP